jgi:hypothetical protein
VFSVQEQQRSSVVRRLNTGNGVNPDAFVHRMQPFILDTEPCGCGNTEPSKVVPDVRRPSDARVRMQAEL